MMGGLYQRQAYLPNGDTGGKLMGDLPLGKKASLEVDSLVVHDSLMTDQHIVVRNDLRYSYL